RGDVRRRQAARLRQGCGIASSGRQSIRGYRSGPLADLADAPRFGQPSAMEVAHRQRALSAPLVHGRRARAFRLIDWIMALPEELEVSFRNDVFTYEKEQNMPWLSSIERSGLGKGLRKGFVEGIAFGLEMKFGAAGRKLLPKVQALPEIADLRRFARFVKQA